MFTSLGQQFCSDYGRYLLVSARISELQLLPRLKVYPISWVSDFISALPLPTGQYGMSKSSFLISSISKSPCMIVISSKLSLISSFPSSADYGYFDSIQKNGSLELKRSFVALLIFCNRGIVWRLQMLCHGLASLGVYLNSTADHANLQPPELSTLSTMQATASV